MKSDQMTVRKRVEEILSLRLLGAEFQDIRQHATAAKWDVSDRQLWRYLERGDRLLAATLEKNRDKILNRHVAQRRSLFARAMSVSDYRTALAVLRDESELLNLYPSKRLEMSGKAGGPVVLSITEEIILRRAPEASATLGDIREEVVTNGSNARTESGEPQQNDPAPSGAASVFEE